MRWPGPFRIQNKQMGVYIVSMKKLGLPFPYLRILVVVQKSAKSAIKQLTDF
jgi:hypothetical protein